MPNPPLGPQPPSSISRRQFTGLLAAGAAIGASGCGDSEPPQPEPAAAKPIKIVDPHVHVWVNDPAYPWPEENKNPPKEDATAEMLLDLMAAHGVSNTVIVHPMAYRWDCRYVGDVMKKYPDKFQGVCRVNPEATDAADELSKWTEEWGYKGVRLSPSASEAGDWITNNDLMDPIWDRAEQLKVPMLILTKTARLPDVQKHIEKHPDMDVVIDHMADCAPTDLDERQKLLTLAKFPRVYCKISHTWSISAEPYPHRDTWDQVKAVYDAFGPNRIMWGTDWPVSKGKIDYGKTLELVRDEMDFFNDEDRQWILGKTIERLWPFDETA